MKFIVFMLRVSRIHFSPVKCSKPFSAKGPIPECKLKKNDAGTCMIHVSQASAFCSGELPPNKYNVPVSFSHAPNPLTLLGYSQANVLCFNFLHCPLSAGVLWGI